MGRVRLGLVVSLSILAVAGGGCGGSDEPSEERIAGERKEAAAQAVQREKIRNLQKELRKRGGSPGKEGEDAPAPSAPTPAAPTPAPASSGGTPCGGGVSVGANTTCPFALNVRNAYSHGSGEGTVTADSPATGSSFTLSCTASPHVCTGGNNASVYFP